MFEEIPEFSSDLEWLLQSGQAGPELVAEALVREGYAPVYRLAFALLGDPEGAQTAAQDTFTAALLELHHYHGQQGVFPWLFRLALRSAHRIERRRQVAARRAQVQAALAELQTRLVRSSQQDAPERDAKAAKDAERSPLENSGQAPLENSGQAPLENSGQAPPDISSEEPPENAAEQQLADPVNASSGEMEGAQPPAIETAPEMPQLLAGPVQGALAALPERTRLIALLYFGLEQPVDSIGRILSVSPEKVATGLNALRASASQTISGQGHADALLDDGVDAWLGAAVEAAWPAPAFDLEQQSDVAAAAAQAAVQHGQRRRKFTSVQEWALTGVVILLLIAVIWAGNRWMPAEEASTTPAATESSLAQAGETESQPAEVQGLSVQSFSSAGNTNNEGVYQVQAGDSLESIALRIGASDEYLRQLNRLAPGERLQPGQKLLVTSAVLPTPTPLAPVDHPPALSVASTSEEIRTRLIERHRMWNTLWFDAQIRDYGPAGFSGPAQTRRVQAWVLRDQGGRLVLVGPPEGPPEEALLLTAGLHFLARPGEDLAPFEEVSPGELTQRLALLRDRLAPLAELDVPWDTFPDMLDDRFQPVGMETVAGVETLVVDRLDAAGNRQSRLWLEPVTGAVLRKQQFGGPDGQTLLWEYNLTGLAFDLNFPPELFDPRLPWRGGYAMDYTGRASLPDAPAPTPTWTPAERQPPERQSAPPGFDPANSRLTFRRLSEANVASDFEDRQAYLYADNYFLGDIPFGDARFTACDRSQDGRRLAYKERFPGLDWQSSVLLWLSLLNPDRVMQEDFGAPVMAFAFAPDNQRLAVVTQGDSLDNLLVFDSASGERRSLFTAASIHSLVWSPDGAFLAFLGVPEGGETGEQVLVVNVASDELVYQAPYNFGDGVAASPITAWGLPFPQEQGGLEACVVP